MGTLDEIRKYREQMEERANRIKVNWLKITPGDKVKVRYLQELDEGALNYNPELGMGKFVTEHVKGQEYQKKFVCTIESEGRCLGCEKARENPKGGFGQKARLYINVLVEKDGELDVAVMSQAMGSKSVIGPMIVDYAVEGNTITDRWWRIGRVGEGNDTQYTPFVMSPDNDINPADYKDKIVDLENVVRHIPYDEQFDAWFAGAKTVEAEKEENTGPSWSGLADREW